VHKFARCRELDADTSLGTNDAAMPGNMGGSVSSACFNTLATAL
jgi:hypothetical protein